VDVHPPLERAPSPRTRVARATDGTAVPLDLGSVAITARTQGSLYVVEDADHAGQCVVTIFVDDLDARVAEIAARGLEPDERLTYSNGVRKAVYRDPDGNELDFGGTPVEAG
jgi:hypothetical protein